MAVRTPQVECSRARLPHGIHQAIRNQRLQPFRNAAASPGTIKHQPRHSAQQAHAVHGHNADCETADKFNSMRLRCARHYSTRCAILRPCIPCRPSAPPSSGLQQARPLHRRLLPPLLPPGLDVPVALRQHGDHLGPALHLVHLLQHHLRMARLHVHRGCCAAEGLQLGVRGPHGSAREPQ